MYERLRVLRLLHDLKASLVNPPPPSPLPQKKQVLILEANCA